MRYRILAAFLQEFRALFRRRIHSEVEFALAYSLQNEFDSAEPTLEQLIHKYNDKGFDRVNLALDRTEQVGH